MVRNPKPAHPVDTWILEYLATGDPGLLSWTLLRGSRRGAYISAMQFVEPIRDMMTRVFFLDRPLDHPPARYAQYFGLGLSAVWIVMLVVHFVAYRKVSLLLLGLVTLVAWVLLWRIGFLMVASYCRWKL